MKLRYRIIVFTTVLCGLLIGCDDFLTEDAKGTLTPDSFFNNEAEANLALNGLQGQMMNVNMNNHLGTDCGVCGRDPYASGWLSAVYQHDASASDVEVIWEDQYTGIKDANMILARIDDSPLSDEVKASTRAQALFYRAMFYFELTTRYGDVPYWRDEIDMAKVAPLGQTEASIIQEAMITDLNEAISDGGLSTGTWADNGGRPTLWAVRMLKAHYHIWLKQWEEARTELIEVTTKYPNIELAPYGDQFREGNEMHYEVIFGREYLVDVVKNSFLINTSHPNASGSSAIGNEIFDYLGIYKASAVFTVRKSFADTYDAADTRKAYNCWGSTVYNDSTVEFNYTYMPKFMGCKLPESDPLFAENLARHNSGQPSRLFKLSDAFLLLSEAEFMIGGSSVEALAPINKVRSRAGLTDLTTLTIEDIQMERGWELIGEGFFGRKRDLIRWGILVDVMKALPAKEKAAGVCALAQTRAEEEAAELTANPEKHLIWPVPASQILLSEDIGGDLVQNPLWR